jgi:hypothetical protein
MNGRVGLDQGFEQGILVRGPFVVAVFGHCNSPCSQPASTTAIVRVVAEPLGRIHYFFTFSPELDQAAAGTQ